jgi:tryptophan-rich sensory protein
MTHLINRGDRVGFIANIVLAVSFAVLANAVIFLAGWNHPDTKVTSFEPPDYVIGIVWLFLFALMGTARWLVTQSSSEAAASHARIVVSLIVLCFLYPFYTLGLAIIPGLIGNIATLLVASWAALQIRSSSKLASTLLFPVIIWICFATALTVLQLTVTVAQS